MSEQAASYPELPSIISLLIERIGNTALARHLVQWESVIFSLLTGFILFAVVYYAQRDRRLVPARLQNAVELIVLSIDDFVCGILGPQGRKHVPFIGTVFLYILCMNFLGIVPFMRSATSNFSITLALGLCAFCYVQFNAIKELGFLRYMDHMLGNPRGGIAYSIVLPLFLFFVHLISELIKPLSLSLRLRSNVLAEDILIAALAKFGLGGIVLLLPSMVLVLITSFIQAVVFSLLTTVYLAIFLSQEEGSSACPKGKQH